MAEKVRIKDIAERAGVSVGTVDRVLHNRPNVSEIARKKIEAALEEMNYQPNVYASALATNRTYFFLMLLPKHAKTAYWEEIEEGAEKAVSNYRDFNISLQILYYDRYDKRSFRNMTVKCRQLHLDGVIIVPSDLPSTRDYTDFLHEENVPFVMLDSFMPDLRPLAFFGQDSFNSGFFAGKMLMMMSNQRKRNKVMMMRPMVNGKVPSKQQANREEGFRHYMIDHFPEVEIINLDLLEDTPKYATEKFEQFLKNNPDVKTCITFSSGAYVMGEYLAKNNIRSIQVMGYDMTPRNEKCLREGTIDFLIAQHGYRQGYYCLKTLMDAVVLQKSVKSVNYMPIELICKENADFYQRYEL
ncbi:MAG: substrate-binding domain-containing protein [Prevotella sp.]|nr:substrate-binding domain-containing protein [Candidatus Equicola faecalis]